MAPTKGIRFRFSTRALLLLAIKALATYRAHAPGLNAGETAFLAESDWKATRYLVCYLYRKHLSRNLVDLMGHTAFGGNIHSFLQVPCIEDLQDLLDSRSRAFFTDKALTKPRVL